MYYKIDTKECTFCMNMTGYYIHGNTCLKDCPQNYTKFNYIHGYNYCAYSSYGDRNPCW